MKEHSEVRDKSKETQRGSSAPNSQEAAQPKGVAWQFYVIIAVIGLGLFMLVAKALGIL